MQAKQTVSIVEIKKQIEDNDYKRYVLSVVSGQESLVIENIKERVKKQGLDESIVDYLNPVVDETIMKKDKKIIKQRKLYPGYVFVKSKMNDKIWYVIRNTPGVRIIVGAETHPIPLSESEYNDIIKQVEAKNERAHMVVPFQEGDVVLMNDGNFSGMKGVIKEVDTNKGFAIVNVEILGRLTPVMIDFDKIELIS
jgi:transcriptional antiterminator NusG